jgi:hypothetical protein
MKQFNRFKTPMFTTVIGGGRGARALGAAATSTGAATVDR